MGKDQGGREKDKAPRDGKATEEEDLIPGTTEKGMDQAAQRPTGSGGSAPPKEGDK